MKRHTMPVQTDQLNALREVFTRDRAWVERHLSDWFYNYFREFYSKQVPFELYVDKARSIMRHTRAQGRSILDVGCGFGIVPMMYRMLGAGSAHGIDYYERKVETAGKLIELLKLDSVRIEQGDGQALPFPAERFDAVTIMAALSHVPDYHKMLAEATRVLKPGGYLYVYEDNNMMYPVYYRAMKKVWEGTETGVYEPDVPQEHRLKVSHRDLRRKMIHEKFPQLGADQLTYCVLRTQGMYGGQIDEAVRSYLATGTIAMIRGFRYRDPEYGECVEHPFHPRVLANQIEKMGYRARFVSTWFGPYRGWKGIIRNVLDRLYPFAPYLLCAVGPVFAITARKTPSS